MKTTPGRFLGRDVIRKPTCPFCGMGIDQPKELATRMLHEMPVGNCACGAVYALDATGHNLGTAMIDALVFGCGGDWDLAFGLLPEDDYLEELVEHYDPETHLVVPGGAYEGRRISGTLYFIRLHEDIREVSEAAVKEQMGRATPSSEGRASKSGRRPRKSFSKKQIEDLVKAYDMKRLLAIAAEDTRIIRDLQRLLYSIDRLIRWRAADLLGKASAIIARKDPGTISRLIQGLLTSLTDTAASSWGSLDALGDIISNSPQKFAGYIPHLYQLTADRSLLPDILRALGKISAKQPDLIRKSAYQLLPLLKDPEPKIRGHAAVILGNVGASEAREDLTKLLNDSATLDIYRDGIIETVTLAQVTSEAIEKL